MKKVDIKKDLKIYTASKDTPTIVNIPEMKFLKVSGLGNPNTSQEYKDAVEALYSVAYAIKFIVKKSQLALDYGVMPLEGLWWVDDMDEFNIDIKDNWKWESMIMQPEFISNELFEEAISQVKKKKKLIPLEKIRFEGYQEGLSAQMMHIGPYSEEKPTIEKLHRFIEDNSYKLHGKHHEIYLSDPRKASPEKLKTIIRQPIM